MKNSGIEWIGEIPDSWELYKIGSLYHCRNEKVNDTDYPPLSVSKGGIVPQMENVAKSDANDNRKMVLKNDFVINSRSDRKQSCGVSPLDGSVSLINTVLYTDNQETILPFYANLVMKNYGFAEEFYRWGHGIVADLWTTRWQEMKSIVLPLPDIEKQTRIVDCVEKKLSQVDELIANQQAQIEKLKEYKQSVITEAVTKGLDKSAPFKDSDIEWIGEIPAHWEVMKIKYLFEESTNRNIDLSFELLTFSGSKGLIRFAEHTDKLPSAEDLTNYKVIHEGQLCMNRMQAWHGMFIDSNIEGCVSPDYAVYIPFKNTNVRYYSYLFRTPRFVQQFANLSKGIGTGFNRLYTPAFFQVDACYPSKEEQDFIVDYLDEKCGKIDRLIAIKQEKIEKLQEYKKSLIYEYVTGKKEVV